MEKILQMKNVSQKVYFVFAGFNNNEPSEGGKNLKLSLLKDALKVFILSKSQMSGDHKFVIIKNTKSIEPSSDLDDLRSEIDSLEPFLCEGSCDFIISKIQESKKPEESFIFQIILIIGDGDLEGLIDNEHSLADIFIDFISIGAEGRNNDQLLSFQNHLIQETSNKSYFFIVKSSSDLFRAMSLLTAHPQQRFSQESLNHLN